MSGHNYEIEKGESIFTAPDDTLSSWGKKCRPKSDPPLAPPRLYFWVSEKKFLSATDEKLSFFCRRTNRCVTQWVAGRGRRRKINFFPHFLTTAHPKKDRRIPNPGTEPETKSTPSQPPKMCRVKKTFLPPFPSAYPSPERGGGRG